MTTRDFFAMGGRSATASDSVLEVLAEWHRLCDALDDKEALNPKEANAVDNPASRYWASHVSTTRPTTLAGAIALLEEIAEDQPFGDVFNNAVACLRQLTAEAAPIETAPIEPGVEFHCLIRVPVERPCIGAARDGWITGR